MVKKARVSNGKKHWVYAKIVAHETKPHKPNMTCTLWLLVWFRFRYICSQMRRQWLRKALKENAKTFACKVFRNEPHRLVCILDLEPTNILPAINQSTFTILPPAHRIGSQWLRGLYLAFIADTWSAKEKCAFNAAHNRHKTLDLNAEATRMCVPNEFTLIAEFAQKPYTRSILTRFWAEVKPDITRECQPRGRTLPSGWAFDRSPAVNMRNKRQIRNSEVRRTRMTILQSIDHKSRLND